LFKSPRNAPKKKTRQVEGPLDGRAPRLDCSVSRVLQRVRCTHSPDYIIVDDHDDCRSLNIVHESERVLNLVVASRSHHP
jgi:hypothetical protein